MTTPLAALIQRALREDAEDVRSEPLESVDGIERERVRFRVGAEERVLVFERMAPRRSLEVQLLPFLARKTDRVPVVHARGIPPARAAAPSWLLVEDLSGARGGCDDDPRRVLEAKVLVEEAVANDDPALAALGVQHRPPALIASEIAELAADPAIAAEANEAARRLAKWPTTIVHGDLRCANAAATQRGVVLRGWARAYLGCALLDVVRLVRDIVERGDAVLGIGLSRVYSERTGAVLPNEILRAAEKLERLASRYLERPGVDR